jgi:hypothetical protein
MDDVMARFRQQPGHHLAHQRVIVHDEYAPARRRHSAI